MKLRPLHDRVIVKRVEEERTTPGGIVIPDSAKEKPSVGEVIAVGEGKWLENGNRRPMDVKIGDKVLFSKFGGSQVPETIANQIEEDVEIVSLDEEQIIAIIDS